MEQKKTKWLTSFVTEIQNAILYNNWLPNHHHHHPKPIVSLANDEIQFCTQTIRTSSILDIPTHTHSIYRISMLRNLCWGLRYIQWRIITYSRKKYGLPTLKCVCLLYVCLFIIRGSITKVTHFTRITIYPEYLMRQNENAISPYQIWTEISRSFQHK